MGIFVTIASSALVERIGHAGYDFIVIDLEHGELALEPAYADLARAAAVSGTATIVRLPLARIDLAGRLADAGAVGVLVPQIETVEEARLAARSASLRPAGVRGFSPQTRAMIHGLATSPPPFATFLQIESHLAIRNLHSILASVSVDGIFVGPHDLALDPKVRSDQSHARAILAARRTTAKAGVPFGNVHPTAEDVLSGFQAGDALAIVSSAILWQGVDTVVKCIRDHQTG